MLGGELFLTNLVGNNKPDYEANMINGNVLRLKGVDYFFQEGPDKRYFFFNYI